MSVATKLEFVGRVVSFIGICVVFGVNLAPAAVQHVVDFNGDAKTDFAIVRNTGGGPGGQLTWFIQNNGGTNRQIAWGLSGDRYVPADFDGDGSSDIAVWRGGPPFGSYFYILRSSNGTFYQVPFGQTGDDPSVTRDYTGDGIADPAVYRSGQNSGQQSFWYFLPSNGSFAGQVLGTAWGVNGDFPAPGDYSGDGKADFVVQRNGGGGQAVFIRRNGTGGPDSGGGASSVIRFGTPTDVILPGDYNGDGITDITVARGQGEQIFWYTLNSGNGSTSIVIWGNSATDVFAQGDYDGDGITDHAVWRPSTTPGQTAFYVRRSGGAGPLTFPWGQNLDVPVAGYDVH